MKYKRDFKVAFTDEWGQVYVYCPVCELPHKKDGVIKHIERKCVQVGEIGHCEWMEINTIKAPTKDASTVEPTLVTPDGDLDN